MLAARLQLAIDPHRLAGAKLCAASVAYLQHASPAKPASNGKRAPDATRSRYETFG